MRNIPTPADRLRGMAETARRDLPVLNDAADQYAGAAVAEGISEPAAFNLTSRVLAYTGKATILSNRAENFDADAEIVSGRPPFVGAGRVLAYSASIIRSRVTRAKRSDAWRSVLGILRTSGDATTAEAAVREHLSKIIAETLAE